mgnify:CR=1 FL=1
MGKSVKKNTLSADSDAGYGATGNGRPWYGLAMIIAVCWFFPYTTMAQQKQPTPILKLTREDSLALKRFTVRFGPYTRDAKVLADDARKLTQAPLVVTGTDNQSWTVLSFRFGYRQRDVNDDARTGKRKLIYTFNATDVQGPRLPQVWQQELADKLIPTEELWFEEIFVQHPKTKVTMKAPPMVLKLQ